MTGRPPLVVGWREWVALPELGVDAIKAKVDTGAATSTLHAWDIDVRDGEADDGGAGGPVVRFVLHPVARDRIYRVEAVAPLVGWRRIRSSNGQVEERPVITTRLALGPRRVRIHLTLTRRDEMGFRMLLGRSALRRRAVVDPGRSFLLPRPGT